MERVCEGSTAMSTKQTDRDSYKRGWVPRTRNRGGFADYSLGSEKLCQNLPVR